MKGSELNQTARSWTLVTFGEGGEDRVTYLGSGEWWGDRCFEVIIPEDAEVLPLCWGRVFSVSKLAIQRDISQEFYLEMLKSRDIVAIQAIPEEYWTLEVFKIAITIDAAVYHGQFLRKVPSLAVDEATVLELTLLAASDAHRCPLFRIPVKYRTPEVCLVSVRQTGNVGCVLVESLTTSVCLAAVSRNCYSFKALPDELKTPAICRVAVYGDAELLQFVPKSCRSLKLYLDAINLNAASIRYVPKEYVEQIQATGNGKEVAMAAPPSVSFDGCVHTV